MNKQSKTFEEIESELQTNLQKIRMDILDMERNIEIGKQMLEKEQEQNFEGETIFKYKNDLAELQAGLNLFQDLEKQMKQALDNLYSTKQKADEYIKSPNGNL